MFLIKFFVCLKKNWSPTHFFLECPKKCEPWGWHFFFFFSLRSTPGHGDSMIELAQFSGADSVLKRAICCMPCVTRHLSPVYAILSSFSCSDSPRRPGQAAAWGLVIKWRNKNKFLRWKLFILFFVLSVHIWAI